MAAATGTTVGSLAQRLLPVLRVHEEVSLTLFCHITSPLQNWSQPMYLSRTNQGTLTSYSHLPLPSLQPVTVTSLH